MTVRTHAGLINVSLGGPRIASYAVLMEYALVMRRSQRSDYFCDEAAERISQSNPNWNDGARPIRVPMFDLKPLWASRDLVSADQSLNLQRVFSDGADKKPARHEAVHKTASA